MSELKFRGNRKVFLNNPEVGEILYAVDTDEWGLCVEENGVKTILWRKHPGSKFPKHVHSGDVPNNSVGLDGDYFIGEMGVYQKFNGIWELVKFPLKRDEWEALFLRKDQSEAILDPNGSVQIDPQYYNGDASEPALFGSLNSFDIYTEGDIISSNSPVTSGDQLVTIGAETLLTPIIVSSDADLVSLNKNDLYYDTRINELKLY